MDKTEFEAELRRDGFRPVYASLRPNMREANHCHGIVTVTSGGQDQV
jgi:hypothetical protein